MLAVGPAMSAAACIISQSPDLGCITRITDLYGGYVLEVEITGRDGSLLDARAGVLGGKR